MGKFTITHTIAGTLDEAVSYTFTTNGACSQASDILQNVAAAWIDVADTSTANNQTIILINTGAVAARYRVDDGTNYARFDLPAGMHAVVPLSLYLPHGAPLYASKRLALWAASATTVRVVTLF